MRRQSRKIPQRESTSGRAGNLTDLSPAFTSKNLQDIAARCDALLESHGLSLEKVAISWLHVLSEHPRNVDLYRRLLRPPAFRSRFVEILHELYRQLRTRARATAFSPDQIVSTVQPTDVVLISHLVNENQLDAEDDFYYGPMQRWLEEEGLRSLLVLRNHLPGPQVALQKRATRTGSRARILLPRSASSAEERDFKKRMRAVSVRIRDSIAGTDALSDAVATESSRRALTESSMANLRLHRQIEQICRVARPRMVMTTYEGHAWERCAWEAARKVDRKVQCVGYQHTILGKNSHAALRDLGSGFDPDLILTLGEITREILATSPSLRQARLAVYGSHRREDRPPLTPMDFALRPDRCLVLPEGLESECVILFEFAVACARLVPDVRFAFRLHPVLSFNSLKKRYSFLRSLPVNVELSTTPSIDEDFRQSKYCMYRGSSSVIYAILAGLKPFYIARENEIPFDPLFLLSSWKEVVKSPAELVSALRSSESDGADELNSALDFCNRYVTPAVRERLRAALINRSGEVPL